MPHRTNTKEGPLAELEQVAYVINEMDEGTATYGTFVFDTSLHRMRGTYWALSKVYMTPDDLFDDLRLMGFQYHCVMKRGWVGRSPC